MLAFILPLIPTLVHLAEQMFGSKAGQDKLAAVLKPLMSFLQHCSGKLGLPMPSQDIVIGEINKVVADLFPSGKTVTASSTLPDAAIKQKIRDVIAWSQGA